MYVSVALYLVFWTVTSDGVIEQSSGTNFQIAVLLWLLAIVNEV